MKCSRCSALSKLIHTLGQLRWFQCTKCGHTHKNQ